MTKGLVSTLWEAGIATATGGAGLVGKETAAEVGEAASSAGFFKSAWRSVTSLFRRRPQSPISVRATVSGLHTPSQVGQIVRDMQAPGGYRYTSIEGRVSGYRVGNTYYIVEGHHRMTAAFRVLQKTGDGTAIRRLIEHGEFSMESRPLGRSYRFPLR